MQFSKKANILTPSLTIQIASKAKQLINQGVDIISLSAGEPDFEPPKVLKDKLKDFIDTKGCGRYGSLGGLSELKKEISNKLKKDNNLDYLEDEIIISSGAKPLILDALYLLIDEGDEVIIPSPYWVSYPMQVKLAGGKPVFVQTNKDYNLDIDAIKQAITSKTKLLIINSPNNPTGAVYSKESLIEIARLVLKKNIFIISDEIYEKITYDCKNTSIASLDIKGIKNQVLTINGFSKVYAIPGWRLGYGAGPKELMTKMYSLQSQSLTHPSLPIQHAALSALQSDSSYLQDWIKEYDNRRKYIVDAFNNLGLSCVYPKGAFYVFVNISKYINSGKFKDSLSFADYILEKAKVAVVPGIAFGFDNHIRVSYTTGRLEEAMNRIKDSLN